MEVESFALDHTRVRAPYVRLAGIYPLGPSTVAKYDLRLAQPNQEALATGALHSLEHLLAVYFRRHCDRVIDLSPMGCRTGFYLVVAEGLELATLRQQLEASLRDVVNHEGPVFGASEVSCGNYLDHDLVGAQSWAAKVLAQGIGLHQT